MSNNTPRRRPITIATDNNDKPEQEYTVPVDVVPSTPVETKQEESDASSSTTAPVEEDVKNKEVAKSVEEKPATVQDQPSDEDWEKAIAEAKEDREKRVVQEKAEQPTPVATPVKIPESVIQAEVEKRLAQIKAEEEKAKQTATPNAPKQHTEITDEEKAKIAEKNDVSNFVNIALGDENDYLSAFEREIDEDDRPESEKTSSPTPYAAGMAVIRQYGQSNNQQKLLARWVGHIIEKNTNALKAVEKEMRMARITPKIGDGSGPKKLTGATARAAVISRMKGMFRVQLYNSGFWLDLRPPTLIDLDGWMTSIDTEFKDLGRVLGGHSHAVIDVYVKQKFFDILPQLIQRSNFENYTDTAKLIANISFHDYDTLLWAMCCMIFRDGVGAGVYCTNPDCRYVDEHQYIDLKNICFLNTEIFNPKAMEWMTRGAHAGSKLLTEDDLKQYREEILGFKKTVKIDNGQTVYDLRVPTAKEYIDESSSMISKMEKLLNGNHDITTDLVSNQLTFHLYKMLTPWIKTLSMYDEKGNLQFQIPDREAIYDSLDVDHLEGTSLYEDVTDFIRDTKVSIYSATTLRCPKCGKVADLKNDNMFPLDMQYLFFCLSCHMLEQTGASY